MAQKTKNINVAQNLIAPYGTSQYRRVQIKVVFWQYGIANYMGVISKPHWYKIRCNYNFVNVSVPFVLNYITKQIGTKTNPKLFKKIRAIKVYY